MAENAPKEKYIVWKLSDILEVCTRPELEKLDTIIDRILRKQIGRAHV